MAKEHSNVWSAGTLHSRNWSDDMIKNMLPEPVIRYFNGRRVRCWQKQDILTAESTEEFARLSQAVRLEREEKRRSSDAEHAESLTSVTSALENAVKPLTEEQTPEAMLALQYHRAVLYGSGQENKNVKSKQAISYIASFRSLLKEEPGNGFASILRHLSSAVLWIGKNPDASAAQSLLRDYAAVLHHAAEEALHEFSLAQPEADINGMLSMEKFPYNALLEHPIAYIYSVFYVPRAIRTSLRTLVALNPKDEYPEARSMRRHFILHIGGTNTGKTYAGFQRLMQAETGVYLSPLRLLALEAQETLLDAHVCCSLTTGEEEDCVPGDTHVAATCEKLDITRHWDVAVIDECQMITDRQRGYAWTRAILGVLAPEVHLCAAPEAENILVWLISGCGDTYEIHRHERTVPLVCMKHTVDYTNLQPGDALITFSKVGVLSAAEDLRQRGREPAIIYGALPYAARRKQMEGFLDGDMRYVVSTDAIGMGLNLPIRRIIFMETKKFDGREVRDLTAAEIKQIAGRAGRYGMYDRGYVGAFEDLDSIRAGLEETVPPITEAVVGFSELMLQVDFDLLEVLQEWSRMPTSEPYVKLDITRYITVIESIRDQGFRLTKEQELRAANIPYDETDQELNKLFSHYLRQWARGEEPDRPALSERPAGSHTLPELEEHCRRLDLYFSFCKAFNCSVDTDALHDEREATAESINRILLYNLQNNIRFCARCGASLPLHYRGRLCNACIRRSGAFKAPKRRKGS